MPSFTNTVPGSAAPSTRDAVLTRSPAIIPWPGALRSTAASPVATPTRIRSSGIPEAIPIFSTSRTKSRPARTARSASSSWATGLPHTPITASPMNLSTVPPYRSITSRATSKYRERRSRMTSGSRDSLIGVNPTMSAKRTETSRRSGVGSSATASGTGAPPPTAVPHSPQNLASGSSGAPQTAQPAAKLLPHW